MRSAHSRRESLVLVPVHDSVTDVTRSVSLHVEGRSKFREILPTVMNVVAAGVSGATFGVAVDGVPVDLDEEVVGSGCVMGPG